MGNDLFDFREETGLRRRRQVGQGFNWALWLPVWIGCAGLLVGGGVLIGSLVGRQGVVAGDDGKHRPERLAKNDRKPQTRRGEPSSPAGERGAEEWQPTRDAPPPPPEPTPEEIEAEREKAIQRKMALVKDWPASRLRDLRRGLRNGTLDPKKLQHWQRELIFITHPDLFECYELRAFCLRDVAGDKNLAAYLAVIPAPKGKEDDVRVLFAHVRLVDRHSMAWAAGEWKKDRLNLRESVKFFVRRYPGLFPE